MTQPSTYIHEFQPGRGDSGGYTLLLLHGTGGSQFDLIPVGQKLLPSAAILSPLGKVSENGMARYFRRVSPGVFDLEDLRFRTHELCDFIGEASTRYSLNRNKIIAVGYSNGANIGASLLLLCSHALRGAILFRPMVPLVPPKLPNLDGMDVLISAARHDQIIAIEEPERLAELLREAGASVTLNWVDAGHALTTEDISVAREWLSKKLVVTK